MERTTLTGSGLNSASAQNCAVRQCRQFFQGWLFFRKSFIDNTVGCRVHTWIGHSFPPSCELRIEIVEVPEAAGQEEVLTNVPERPLDFTLRFRPVGTAGFRGCTIVVEKRHQRGVVRDNAGLVFAYHRSLHAVIENFFRRTALRIEGRYVTAHDRLEVLAGDEPTPEPTAVPHDQREEPYFP